MVAACMVDGTCASSLAEWEELVGMGKGFGGTACISDVFKCSPGFLCRVVHVV